MDNLILQGVNLMLYGMGTVFVFLILLVFMVKLMTVTINKIAPEPEVVAQPHVATAVTKTASAIDPTTFAVLQAAIDQHRGKSL